MILIVEASTLLGDSLHKAKIHIIHVGSLANKGTQALLRSDILALRRVMGKDVEISISSADPEEVRRKLSVGNAFLPMIDIPHDKGDVIARRSGFDRASLRYKASVLSSLLIMPLQMILSILSASLMKIGVRPFYRNEVLKHFRECDLVVSCSDENFKEGTSLLRLKGFWMIAWWSMLLSRVFDVLIARFLKKRIIMFPNSIGPFQTVIGRCLAKLALQSFDYLLVRDSTSWKIASSLNIEARSILTHDMALLFKPSNIEPFEKPHSLMVGVSLGVYDYALSRKETTRLIYACSMALDKIIEKYRVFVLLLPHYITGISFDDLKMSELVLGNMKNKEHAKIVKLDEVDGFYSVLKRMDMVVSSKMHPAVLATSACIPTLCIAYDQKQTGYFEQLKMDECLVPIEQASQKLWNRMDYVWTNRERIRSELSNRIPLMQKRLERTIERVLDPVKPRHLGPMNSQ